MPYSPGRFCMTVIDRIVPTLSCVFGLLALLVTSVPTYAQEGTVNSRLSRNTITKDESVTLEIVAVGLDKELDLSSLDKDFEVAGRSSSREINSILSASGELKTTSIVTWTVQLLPKDTGVFTVPPVRVGDVSSQAHTLTVNDLPKGAQREIFIEAEVDTTSPWVQSQVLMTLKVFQAIEIIDGGLDVPESENLVVERLGEDIRSTETRDGRQYSVTTRKFALFPQKSGEMIINPITLSVSVPADPNRVRTFFSPTRKLTRRTDRTVLNVKPRPDNGAAWWLPAKSVQLASEWVGGVDQAAVDQPLTRKIILRASGVADSQLPDINIPAVEGASLYAEQPVRKLGADRRGLVSELTLNWALIPQRLGTITLPPVNVEWFNTTTGTVEVATLAAEKIEVTTSQAGPATTYSNDASALADNSTQSLNPLQTAIKEQATEQASAENTLSNPVMESRIAELESKVSLWRTLVILVSLLWLGSALFYWWAKLRSSNNPLRKSRTSKLGAVRNAAENTLNAMQPLGSVAASCKSGDLHMVRSAVLEWSARQWPDSAPISLTELAKRLGEGPAHKILTELDAALYGSHLNNKNDNPLTSRLENLPEKLKMAVESNDSKKGNLDVTSTDGLPAL